MSLEVQPKGYQSQLEESLGQQKGSERKPEASAGEPERSECHGTLRALFLNDQQTGPLHFAQLESRVL